MSKTQETYTLNLDDFNYIHISMQKFIPKIQFLVFN